MASAAGKCKTKTSSLPTGLVYDLSSLSHPPHSAPSARASLQDDLTPPRVSPNSIQGNSQDLELVKLQTEKQRLELVAQAKVRSLSSPGSVKPAAIPSPDTVRSGHNAVKAQSQLDHNTRITNP